jgi:hypothetical protein
VARLMVTADSGARWRFVRSPAVNVAGRTWHQIRF